MRRFLLVALFVLIAISSDVALAIAATPVLPARAASTDAGVGGATDRQNF